MRRFLMIIWCARSTAFSIYHGSTQNSRRTIQRNIEAYQPFQGCFYVPPALEIRDYMRLLRRFAVDLLPCDRLKAGFRLCYLQPLTSTGPDRMTIKAVAKFCSVAAMVLFVFIALGPANWTPRTALGWQFDHFAGYFAITLLVCFAWPRPVVVGGALMAFSALLEGLQAFTPDRSSNSVAAICGTGGALAAALLAEVFIRVRRRRAG
jgi:VanZ family protein